MNKILLLRTITITSLLGGCASYAPLGMSVTTPFSEASTSQEVMLAPLKPPPDLPPESKSLNPIVVAGDNVQLQTYSCGARPSGLFVTSQETRDWTSCETKQVAAEHAQEAQQLAQQQADAAAEVVADAKARAEETASLNVVPGDNTIDDNTTCSRAMKMLDAASEQRIAVLNARDSVWSSWDKLGARIGAQPIMPDADYVWPAVRIYCGSVPSMSYESVLILTYAKFHGSYGGLPY